MFVGYFSWHYSYAFVDGYRIYRDGVGFLYRYFSIERMIRTFARPLPGAFERGPLMRTLSRLVGAGMRTVVLVLGCTSIVAWNVIVFGFMAVWPFLPLVTAGGLVASVIGLGAAL